MDIVVSITQRQANQIRRTAVAVQKSEKSVYLRWPLVEKPNELEKGSWIYFAWSGAVKLRFRVVGFSESAPVTLKGQSFMGPNVLLDPEGKMLEDFIPVTQFKGWRYFY